MAASTPGVEAAGTLREAVHEEHCEILCKQPQQFRLGNVVLIENAAAIRGRNRGRSPDRDSRHRSRPLLAPSLQHEQRPQRMLPIMRTREVRPGAPPRLDAQQTVRGQAFRGERRLRPIAQRAA